MQDIGVVQLIFISLSFFGLGFLFLFIYFIKKHYIDEKIVLKRTMDWVFLEITVPKDVKDEDKPKNEEEKKNLISVAEQMFTALSEMSEDSINPFNQKQYLTFEIACVDQKISFYINCPKALLDIVEKQVHAQYPNAFIDQIKGYNPFAKKGFTESAEIVLKKKYFYPLRNYRNMESDPLNSLTSSMSKLQLGEGAAMQFVVYPAGNSWQERPRRMALEIQQGKNPNTVDKGVFGKIFSYILFEAWKGDNANSKSNDLSGDYKPINLTPMQQEMVKKFEQKASRPGFDVNIRLITSSPNEASAKLHMQNLKAAFLQYAMPPFNGFKVKNGNRQLVKDYIFRVYRSRWKKNILNTEELASLWHLPTFLLETPNIKWLTSKKAPPPNDMTKEGVLLGKNVFRGVETEARIARDDRRRHMYIIGRTGSGKTEIMKYMSVQDIKNGEGLCVIDPHGDFIEDILPHVPKERADDVILFEPFNTSRPMGLNMLEVDNEEQKDFVIQEMISIFYKLVTDPAMLGPMFEHNMRNAMLTLMADEEHPGTLVEIPRIFTDVQFQKYKIAKLKDPVVRAFWEKEMAKTSDFHKSEMLGYLISKVGRFVGNSMMRNIVGQSKSSFNFRDVMDNRKILLVNLAKGKVGEINAKLLGLILVSKIQMAALSRADMPEGERKDFYLYVDEFQNFITDAFSSILSEARKYRLNLIIAHQFLSQLQSGAGAHGAASSDLKSAVFGNCGSMLTFRIGVEDAEVFAKEYSPTFSQFDVLNIDRYNAYIKLLINGTGSKPFNIGTYPVPKATEKEKELAEVIRELSGLKYGRSRASVEAEVLEAAMVAENLSKPMIAEPSL